MSSTRTIFIQNGLPIFENHISSTGHAWWVSVNILDHEINFSDVNLIDILIARLQSRSFEITQGIAMHHRQKLWVSFPADLSLPMSKWAALAIKYAEHYKEDIITGPTW
ncbi:hypothetical protein N7517_011397 [Penicillium concentricum]|uniref:Uncharacterized protein n=1 Tax=Penicillium concentricum TaxID=293559 RepID=A0A9W9RFY0_9EURO|nr:uncharacterized protein N7517_011397 [Penicillium concentricum]KAJ5356788.1 hypothetical protein N7517_011397 [Penicillium concentricum]